MPRTKNAISSRLSAAPSRFLRIISCGSSVWVRSDAIGNPHVLDLASVGEEGAARGLGIVEPVAALAAAHPGALDVIRSEEHTSELQSLMRISYAVFCL